MAGERGVKGGSRFSFPTEPGLPDIVQYASARALPGVERISKGWLEIDATEESAQPVMQNQQPPQLARQRRGRCGQRSGLLTRGRASTHVNPGDSEDGGKPA